MERRAKRLGVQPERLLAWRQRHSRRPLASLRSELDRLSLVALPRSPLGQAIGYTLNNWKVLTRYSEASFLTIDNNHSERPIKQLVIGRKNWMFAGSEAGAKNAALRLSLAVSCKLVGVDPFAYFRGVLLCLHSPPAERIAELIPREWKTRFARAATTPLIPQPESRPASPRLSAGRPTTRPLSSAYVGPTLQDAETAAEEARN